MKTITLLETPEELLQAADKGARELGGRPLPRLPQQVYLVVEGSAGVESLHLSGEGSDLFALGEKITYPALCDAALRLAGFSKVHRT